MSLFANYRADRLSAELNPAGNPGSPLAQKALEKLVGLGPNAIDPIVAAALDCGKEGNRRLRRSIVQAQSTPKRSAPSAADHGVYERPRHVGHRVGLSSSRNYHPARAVGRVGEARHAEQAIIDVIAAQKTRFTVRNC